jgi:hypothetical protein
LSRRRFSAAGFRQAQPPIETNNKQLLPENVVSTLRRTAFVAVQVYAREERGLLNHHLYVITRSLKK